MHSLRVDMHARTGETVALATILTITEARSSVVRVALHIATMVLAVVLLSHPAQAQRSVQPLEGQVVNADGDVPLANLTMDLFDAQGMRQPITWEADGRFKARIDRTRFHQLVVYADGFAVRREPIISCSYQCTPYPCIIALTNRPLGICGNP